MEALRRLVGKRVRLRRGLLGIALWDPLWDPRRNGPEPPRSDFAAGQTGFVAHPQVNSHLPVLVAFARHPASLPSSMEQLARGHQMVVGQFNLPTFRDAFEAQPA